MVLEKLSVAFIILLFLGYPGIADEKQNGVPYHLFGTQWKVNNIIPTRLHQGGHLLYMNSTSNGVSGSPLYKINPDTKQALAIGVHVGGGRVMGYAAVPLSYHFKNAKISSTTPKTDKKPSKFLPMLIL